MDDFSTGNRQNLAGVANRIELLEGSVTDPIAADKAVANCELVFHLAALPSVVKSVENPVESNLITANGTLHILDAARRAKVRRVVYAGSSSAYGDQPGERRGEDDLLIPLSPYAASKLAGEHFCACFTAAFGLETARLRFFNVFGPRQDAKSPYSGVIALFIAAMSQGRRPTIFGDGLQVRDFVFVTNVVEALLSAANAPRANGNVYNIGNGGGVTILELVRALNRLLKTELEPHFGPARAGDVRYSQADITRARRDLDYEPAVSFEDGLRATLAAYHAIDPR